MSKEYYWASGENALYTRKCLAHPAAQTLYRFKRGPAGEFSLAESRYVPASIENAPGFYTAVYLPTGDILEYTERFSGAIARPLYRDARFVGEFDPNEVVILQHKDGYAAKYQIGPGGADERELTVYQARWLEEACSEAGREMPLIEGYEPTILRQKAAAVV